MTKLKDIHDSFAPTTLKEAKEVVRKYLIEDMKDETYAHENFDDVFEIALAALFLAATVINKEKSMTPIEFVEPTLEKSKASIDLFMSLVGEKS